MKTKRYFILSIIICMVISCKTNTHTDPEKIPGSVDQLEKASLLIGKWGNNQYGVELMEMWTKENDSVYTGISYSIRNGVDTISSERIRLEKQNDKLFYIPVVKNQNQGEVVKFELTTANEHELVFENPEHDFPQKISYLLVNKDSLFAEISGVYKGERQSEKFPMHKME